VGLFDHDGHGVRLSGMAITHLLYLHGFRSSPLSAKAQRLAAWVRRHQPGLTWWCPQLPDSPQAAATLITQGLRDWPTDHMAVVGSSLGGFYATWVAARWGCKAVLLNPAVDPARDLAAHIGVHPQWHQPQEQVFFQAAHVDELRALYVGRGLPLRTPSQVQAPELDDPTEVLAIVAQGDEVLDWREMVARYPQAALRLIAGSDHGLSDFDDHLPVLTQYLGWGSAMP